MIRDNINENTPTANKKSQSVKKKMIAVFFKLSGILQHTAELYTEHYLSRDIESLKNQRQN